METTTNQQHPTTTPNVSHQRHSPTPTTPPRHQVKSSKLKNKLGNAKSAVLGRVRRRGGGRGAARSEQSGMSGHPEPVPHLEVAPRRGHETARYAAADAAAEAAAAGTVAGGGGGGGSTDEAGETAGFDPERLADDMAGAFGRINARSWRAERGSLGGGGGGAGPENGRGDEATPEVLLNYNAATDVWRSLPSYARSPFDLLDFETGVVSRGVNAKSMGAALSDAGRQAKLHAGRAVQTRTGFGGVELLGGPAAVDAAVEDMSKDAAEASTREVAQGAAEAPEEEVVEAVVVDGQERDEDFAFDEEGLETEEEEEENGEALAANGRLVGSGEDSDDGDLEVEGRLGRAVVTSTGGKRARARRGLTNVMSGVAGVVKVSGKLAKPIAKPIANLPVARQAARGVVGLSKGTIRGAVGVSKRVWAGRGNAVGSANAVVAAVAKLPETITADERLKQVKMAGT